MSAYDGGSGLYDPLMELPENLGLGRLRAQTLRGIRGRVLELGIGTGRNIPLYPPSVERLHGIDSDEAMLSRARRRTEKAAFPVELVAGSAEELPFDDQGFDAVSATLAFCTIPHPAEALLEARRMLKGGGELRLLEHVRMEHRPIGWLQEKATPLRKRVAGGCHLDRDTLALVHEAGFEVERVERHLDGLVLAVFARSSRAETTATRRTANRGTGS